MPMSSWLRRQIDRELSLQDLVEAFLNIQQQNNLLFSCCNSLKTERCPPPRVNPPIQPIAPVDSFPLPSKFEGANNPNQADMWPKWLRHFEPYRIASGLQNKSFLKYMKIHIFALRWKDEIRRSSQLRTLLKQAWNFFSGPIYNYSFQ